MEPLLRLCLRILTCRSLYKPEGEAGTSTAKKASATVLPFARKA